MKSIASRILPVAAVAVTLFSLSGTARADALPPDGCSDSASVGSTCSNAGTSYDEPGTCENSTCLHSVHLEDGGFASGNEPCVLCIASDGGTSTTTDGGGATTVRVDAGTETSAPSSSSSGCSATPDSRDGATGFAMLVVGMIGLVLSRRKKSA